MKKKQNITEIVTELQSENERLKELKKLFERAVKDEFGYTIKQLHELVKRQEYYDQRRAERQGQYIKI